MWQRLSRGSLGGSSSLERNGPLSSAAGGGGIELLEFETKEAQMILGKCPSQSSIACAFYSFPERLLTTSVALQGAKMARLGWLEMQKLSTEEHTTCVEFLSQVPILQSCSPEQRLDLAKYTTKVEYAEGELIAKQVRSQAIHKSTIALSCLRFDCLRL